MFHLLYKYLISYKYVNIPGIGQFSFEKQPATIDSDGKLLLAPVTRIKFATQPDTADKSFHNFIASQLNVDVDNAAGQYKAFAGNLKSTITHHVTELPSLGTLGIKDSEVVFEPQSAVKDYYPDIDLDEMLQFLKKEDEHVTEERKQLDEAIEKQEARSERNSWLLYALILAVIGIGAIAYYYLQMQD